MGSYDISPIDFLSYVSEELESKLKDVGNDVEREFFVFEHLRRSLSGEGVYKNLDEINVEIEDGLDWFNVKHPLKTEDLNEGITVLVFFTYSCINCYSNIAELSTLFEKYNDLNGIVFVGVHSPKFPNEKKSKNVQSAIEKHNIKYPVVNDFSLNLWRKLNIYCWPSMMILGPQLKPVLLLMGEGHLDFLDYFCKLSLKYFKRPGPLSVSDLTISCNNACSNTTLKFPSNIACCKLNNTFALADSGNNRILVFDIHGKVLNQIGGKKAGYNDGEIKSALFNAPQGVTFLESFILIVADTNNHALRKINLSTGIVETLAGNGQRNVDRVGGKAGPLQALAYPWDVTVFRARDMDMSFHEAKNQQEKVIILVCLAGSHQVWGYFPDGIIWWKFKKFEPYTCVSLIGTGVEENRNNSCPQNASLAQPTGLTVNGNSLFISDSESSTIRRVSLVDGKVSGLVGGDRNHANLFAYGHIDGEQCRGRLQHPMSLTYNHRKKMIYICDTYNNSIRVVDLETAELHTLIFKMEDNCITFNEPGGVCFDVDEKYLFVSDTNNHRLLKFDAMSLKATPFDLKFCSENPKQAETDLFSTLPSPKNVHAENPLKITIRLETDSNLKLHEDSLQSWTILKSSFSTEKDKGTISGNTFTITINNSNKTMLDEKPVEHLELYISICVICEKSYFIKKFSLFFSGTEASTNDSTSLDHYVRLMVSKNEVRILN